MIRIFVCLGALGLLAACGQTGPLVLPEKAEPAATEPSAAAGEAASPNGEAVTRPWPMDSSTRSAGVRAAGGRQTRRCRRGRRSPPA